MTEQSKKQPEEPTFLSKQISRRDMLKIAGAGGIGLALGASGAGSLLTMTNLFPEAAEEDKEDETVPFYGAHQAGIATPMQNHVYFAAMDVTAESRSELIQLFQDWTKAAALMTAGKPVGENSGNDFLPPKDTGEAAELSPSNLTITFGVGPTLFVKDGKDRFGLKRKQSGELKELPKFPLDALDEKWCGGDLCIQACADDAQVAFHAVRNLVRIARGKATIRWAQAGFQRSKQAASSKKDTPRNLFGFKDGTVNPDVHNAKEMNRYVWVQPGDGPNWLINGSYLVVRRIQMHIEVWDRSSLRDQEETFGRHKASGAPLGQKDEFDPLDLKKKRPDGQYYIPVDSHVRLAHHDGTEKILRRSYSYADGMDPKTGSLDAGLLFMCYQRKPSRQFIPIQSRLSQNDKLNEYITHRGSAIFACFPGVKKGGYIGESLFE
ncbi:iron uptake transporter deferrochelatase/peroxidase subunit [Bacillus smithii]|uniref:iron uptake transporter deferrochelatase/peroxidase subunit n=1 Tax=Bacillus smithii TaxID=1479 RepID=UPI003D1D89F8